MDNILITHHHTILHLGGGVWCLVSESAPHFHNPIDFAPHVWKSFQAKTLCQRPIGLAQTPARPQ